MFHVSSALILWRATYISLIGLSPTSCFCFVSFPTEILLPRVPASLSACTMTTRAVLRLHFIVNTLFYNTVVRNNNPSVLSGTFPVLLMGIRFPFIRHCSSWASLASALLDLHTIGASLAVCYVCVLDQKATKWQWKQVLDASRGSALSPADDIFWPTPDQNRQRVVCAHFVELCNLPYTLMLLMVYCI